MSSSDAPNESSAYLSYEKLLYASLYIGTIGYGLLVAAVSQCFRSIMKDRTRASFTWLPLVATLFILGTVNIACNINYTQLAWINDRDYPGGPVMFIVEQQTMPVNMTALATSIVALFLSDSFLIYRLYSIFTKIYLSVFLLLFLGASTVLSILHTIQSAHATIQELDKGALSLSLPYVAFAMTLNVLLSVALLWRLSDLRQRFPSTIEGETLKKYIGVEALAVEGALPYGLASFLLAVLYGARSSGVNLLIPLLVQLQCLVPTLIVTRMARGHAWSNDTIRRLTSKNTTSGSENGSAPVGNSITMLNMNNPFSHPDDAKVSSPAGMV